MHRNKKAFTLTYVKVNALLDAHNAVIFFLPRPAGCRWVS